MRESEGENRGKGKGEKRRVEELKGIKIEKGKVLGKKKMSYIKI